MIKRPTVLILGAGASAGPPLNFPTGRKLLERICKNAKTHETTQLVEELRLPVDDLGPFIHSLENSPLSSVDAFLERRPEFIDLGKALIAKELIPHEVEKNLKRQSDQTWYGYFFEKWWTNVGDYDQNKLSIITFNYDRSLEYFLFGALTNVHGLPSPEIAQLLQKMEIIHLHGKLGDIPFIDGKGRRYNNKVNAQSVKESAQSIRIVHEDVSTLKEFQRAKELLATAETVCFLGFGYHHTNIERLDLHVLKDEIQCVLYGSSFKMKLGEEDIAQDLIAHKRINFGGEHLDCLGMLRRYPILR